MTRQRLCEWAWRGGVNMTAPHTTSWAEAVACYARLQRGYLDLLERDGALVFEGLECENAKE